MKEIPFHLLVEDKNPKYGVHYLGLYEYWENFLRAVHNEANGDMKQRAHLFEEWKKEWKVNSNAKTGMLEFDTEEDAIMFILRWS